MDGNYVCVPDGEYNRLCMCEELCLAVLEWLAQPENYPIREWVVDELVDDDMVTRWISTSR